MDEKEQILNRVLITLDNVSVCGEANHERLLGTANAIRQVIRMLKEPPKEATKAAAQNAETEEVTDNG